MTDRQKIMSDLEGLTFDDWHMFHCDTDVQGTAIDALELLKHDEQTIESLQHTISKLTKAIAEKPEVVRCKNCKYGEPVKNILNEDRYECHLPESYVISDLALPPDWFCGDGEVRKDE